MSKNSLINGKLKLTTSKYYMIEKAIALLEQNNFELNNIETGGDGSSHMGVGEFTQKYNTLKEYYDNASSDYINLCKNEIYSVSWNYTYFHLKNNDENTEISIVVCHYEFQKEPETAAYFISCINSSEEYNPDYAEDLKRKLDALNN